MSNERSKSETNNSSEIDWTPENEIKLFYALRGHKPVGKYRLCMFVSIHRQNNTKENIINF